jgi:hypothetical protein
VRDPRRIDDVLLAIAEVWALDPDLRLGQLLVNAVRPGEPGPEVSGIEDAELVRRVQAEGRRIRAARAGSPGFESEPTAEQWAEIDARILACDILGALTRIRAACGCGLNDAKGVHISRYRQLRAERATEFACSDEQYWAGVFG